MWVQWWKLGTLEKEGNFFTYWSRMNVSFCGKFSASDFTHSFLMFCWPCILYNLVSRTNLVHNFFLNMFSAFLYMFRATMCPSSGEVTVTMQHLVFVTLYRWLSGMQGGIHSALHTSHPYRVTNTRCRIGTVISPDDGHIVARNM